MGSDLDLPVYRIVPSMRAPVTHAARYAVSSPLSTGDAVAAFGRNKALGTWNYNVFDADRRSSHACVSTHQHVGYPRCCKTHLRPAGLSFSRAGFPPAGRLTEFPEVSPPPFQRTSIDWSLLLPHFNQILCHN